MFFFPLSPYNRNLFRQGFQSLRHIGDALLQGDTYIRAASKAKEMATMLYGLPPEEKKKLWGHVVCHIGTDALTGIGVGKSLRAPGAIAAAVKRIAVAKRGFRPAFLAEKSQVELYSPSMRALLTKPFPHLSSPRVFIKRFQYLEEFKNELRIWELWNNQGRWRHFSPPEIIAIDDKARRIAYRRVPGHDVEEILKRFPKKLQHEAAGKVGRAFQELHRRDVMRRPPHPFEDWNKIGKMYDDAARMAQEEVGVRLPYTRQELRGILADYRRSPKYDVLVHGDPHFGNMRIPPSGKLVLLDLDLASDLWGKGGFGRAEAMRNLQTLLESVETFSSKVPLSTRKEWFNQLLSAYKKDNPLYSAEGLRSWRLRNQLARIVDIEFYEGKEKEAIRAGLLEILEYMRWDVE